MAVYLNGERIVLENLAWNADYQTLADRRDPREGIGTGFIHPKAARVGKNCLAVEVHRHTPFATDLDMDLRLSVPRRESLSLDAVVGKANQRIPRGSVILRARLSTPLTAATSNLRRLRRERSFAEEVFPLPWMQEEPLQWGHDRGSQQIDFDVTDTVQAWCDGVENTGWMLLPGDDRIAVDHRLNPFQLQIWFVEPHHLNALVSVLSAFL